MSYVIPPPIKVEFPEQIALSDRIDGDRGDIAASEKAVGTLNEKISSLEGYQSGDIKIHNGTLDNIPNGWVLCDGENGTPAMVDRALVGAGGQYEPNQTFGHDSQTPTINVQNHTLSNAQGPNHYHSFPTYGVTSSRVYAGNTAQANNGKTIYTSSSGSNEPHNHGASSSNIDTRQKSIALIWIMKL